ncbi:MAG: NAD-dependent epimerase/dehydratase family protein [Candidatus Freyarchaeota archaeon]
MRVLVTGGAGYIGSVLVRILLERGYRVRCLDRFFFGFDPVRDVEDDVNFEVVKGDVRFVDGSVMDGVDAVFDLAALSNDPTGELDPGKTMEINYRGRVRVARLARKHGVERYVLASSCSVYGFQDGLLREDSEVNPLTTYARANVLAEREVLPLSDGRFTVTVLRQATVYGFSYRMRFDLAVNGMVRGFFKNGRVPILRDGTQWRPFVHVRDTSRAFVKVLEAERELVDGQVFNVGSNEQNYQIFRLAETIADAIGLPFEYEWYGFPDHRSYRVCFDKIAGTLGFKPEYDVRRGAREVYDALKDGRLDPDDPRTITVKWYKHLLEMREFLKEIELDGVLL